MTLYLQNKCMQIHFGYSAEMSRKWILSVQQNFLPSGNDAAVLRLHGTGTIFFRISKFFYTDKKNGTWNLFLILLIPQEKSCNGNGIVLLQRLFFPCMVQQWTKIYVFLFKNINVHFYSGKYYRNWINIYCDITFMFLLIGLLWK